MSTTFKRVLQDMPPEGGYKPLQWERIKLKRVLGTVSTIGFFTMSTFIGLVGVYNSYKRYRRHKIEMMSAKFAMLPMLIAERDRAYLKQLRKNQDIERELMKNVPEWDVGTYFGEPIYITTQEKFFEPHYYEFMAHGDLDEAWKHHLDE